MIRRKLGVPNSAYISKELDELKKDNASLINTMELEWIRIVEDVKGEQKDALEENWQTAYNPKNPSQND